MFEHESLPRLHEVEPRKGFVLLVPWMMFGLVWLGMNQYIGQTTVTLYFSLLVAGTVSLVMIDRLDRTAMRELTELKLLPFVLFFGLALAGVFLAFAAIRLSTVGTLFVNTYNPATFSNFLATTVLVVAPVETLVFQYVLPKVSTMTMKTANLAILGGIMAQLTFAGFHYFAYSYDWLSMGFVFVLGIGFYALVKLSPVWGLGAAMGAHSGWNIAVALMMEQGMNQIGGFI
jgi:hypothetical protein